MLKLQKPPLVRETSITTSTWKRFAETFKKQELVDIYENVILKDELRSKLEVVSDAIINRKNNNSYYRNILIHGPPGTGKTLWAK